MKIFGLAIIAATCLVSYSISSGDNVIAIAANVLLYVSAIGLYLFPSIYIALIAPIPPRRIFIVNLLTGWTLVGWCAAFYLALSDPQDRHVEEDLQKQG